MNFNYGSGYSSARSGTNAGQSSSAAGGASSSSGARTNTERHPPASSSHRQAATYSASSPQQAYPAGFDYDSYNPPTPSSPPRAGSALYDDYSRISAEIGSILNPEVRAPSSAGQAQASAATQAPSGTQGSAATSNRLPYAYRQGSRWRSHYQLPKNYTDESGRTGSKRNVSLGTYDTAEQASNAAFADMERRGISIEHYQDPKRSRYMRSRYE